MAAKWNEKTFSTFKILSTPDTPGVQNVVLDRPEVRNAFNDTLIAELTEVFTELENDPAVRVVTLSGTSPIFCAGGDLNWMKRSIALSYDANLRDTLKLSDLFQKLNAFKKPLIGLVEGAAIGGGVGLVSVCDYVVATKNSQFSLSEVRLGLVPACIGPYVIQKIGASHARALFLSAERFDAEKALRIGLIHEVVADYDALMAKGYEVARRLLECGPQALRKAKELILNLTAAEGFSGALAEQTATEYVSKMLAELRVSPEGQEGLKAFLEKRKPQWGAG